MSVLNQSVLSMAKMIRAREISSAELIAAHLERIQQVNPAINAVTDLLAASALREPEAADRMVAIGDPRAPLHGVPLSIKDSIIFGGRISLRNGPFLSAVRCHSLPPSNTQQRSRMEIRSRTTISKDSVTRWPGTLPERPPQQCVAPNPKAYQ